METTIDQADVRDAGPAEGVAAAKKIATEAPEPDKDGKLEPEQVGEVMEATSWLLQSFDERETTVTRPIDLNVGSAAEPKWITWTIKAVEGDELRRIRARAADGISSNTRGPQASLRTTQTAARANAEIVVVGTLEPNLLAVAGQRQLADPTILVEEAFKSKPGLIDQVSAAIMELSGYDDEAIRDSVERRAAGN